ncbi:MAG TPA: hypothetical protein VGC24_11295 [Burkholderiaceae bacterium]
MHTLPVATLPAAPRRIRRIAWHAFLRRVLQAPAQRPAPPKPVPADPHDLAQRVRETGEW